MGSSILLSPQGTWSAEVQYTIGYVAGAAAIGLSYLSYPLVKDAGSLWYASGNIQPTLGKHPAEEPAIWTLVNAGSVIKTAAPTSGDDSGDGYAVGILWFNSNNGDAYICTVNTVGAAVWT